MRIVLEESSCHGVQDDTGFKHPNAAAAGGGARGGKAKGGKPKGKGKPKGGKSNGDY